MAGNQSAKAGEGAMSVDAKLKKALAVFGDPVANAVYYGEAKRYYVFNYSTMGAGYADDEPTCERYMIQVHLFAPLSENITKRVKETKKALNAAGFTWPSTENASDEDSRHIVFECEAAEGMD